MFDGIVVVASEVANMAVAAKIGCKLAVQPVLLMGGTTTTIAIANYW